MPRPCSICIHEQRNEIDQAIMRGDPFSAISRNYSVSRDAVRRHKLNGHIGKEVIEARQVEVVERSADVWTQIDYWSNEIKGIYREAKQRNEKSIALTAIDKAMKLIALTTQIRTMVGEDQNEVDPVTLAHEIMEYLGERYPDAKQGLLKHLQELYERDSAHIVEDDDKRRYRVGK